MKVLVTGANGFLGLALVRHLLDARYEVKAMIRKESDDTFLKGLDLEVVRGDIRDTKAVKEAVSACQVIFHLASLYQFYPWWERKAEEIYKINVEGTRNVLTAALSQNVERFIFTSSIASLCADITHYGRSKLMAEKEVIKACANGLAALILNPAIIIGEKDWKPTPSGEIILNFLNHKYFCYFETELSFTDVDDVAGAHVSAIKNGRIGEKYILCGERPYTLTEIFKFLEEISGISAPRIKISYSLLLNFAYFEETMSSLFLKKRPLMPSEGVKFCRAPIRFDNAKAVKELGFALTPIKDTLRKAVDWYRENGYVKNA